MRSLLAVAAVVAAALPPAPAAAQDAAPPAPAPSSSPEKAEPAPTAKAPAEETVSEAAEEASPERKEEAAAVAPASPAEERAQLAKATERGRQLFGLARAGLLSTRDLFSRVSDPRETGIVGWVAVPAGNAMTVTYYGEGEDGPEAVYRSQVLGNRVVSRELFPVGKRPRLTALEARMAAARAAATALEHKPCGTAEFNVLAVPPVSADDPIDVYHLTPQVERGSYPVGGHYRATVAADGSVSAHRGFTNSCLLVPLPDTPEGALPRPIAVTHLLDPLPTEIHVLSAMMTGRPLLVATGDPQRIWAVTGDGIAEVRDR